MKLLLLSLFIFPIAYGSDGSSGCGPGWYVLKENSLVSSSLRATTNGILFPTTTIGMTMGTSNCTQHKIVLHEKKALHLVTHSLQELKSESTRGNGDYLYALANTLGCKSGSEVQLGREMKEKFEKIYQRENPEAVLSEIFKVIFTSPELTESCSLS